MLAALLVEVLFLYIKKEGETMCPNCGGQLENGQCRECGFQST